MGAFFKVFDLQAPLDFSRKFPLTCKAEEAKRHRTNQNSHDSQTALSGWQHAWVTGLSLNDLHQWEHFQVEKGDYNVGWAMHVYESCYNHLTLHGNKVFQCPYPPPPYPSGEPEGPGEDSVSLRPPEITGQVSLPPVSKTFHRRKLLSCHSLLGGWWSQLSKTPAST